MIRSSIWEPESEMAMFENPAFTSWNTHACVIASRRLTISWNDVSNLHKDCMRKRWHTDWKSQHKSYCQHVLAPSDLLCYHKWILIHSNHGEKIHFHNPLKSYIQRFWFIASTALPAAISVRHTALQPREKIFLWIFLLTYLHEWFNGNPLVKGQS